MKSLEELASIREKALLEKSGQGREADFVITIGMATCGITAGARPVFTALLEFLSQHSEVQCKVLQTGCFGSCQLEPMMTITSLNGETTTYVKLTPEKIAEIGQSHLCHENPVEAYKI